MYDETDGDLGWKRSFIALRGWCAPILWRSDLDSHLLFVWLVSNQMCWTHLQPQVLGAHQGARAKACFLEGVLQGLLEGKGLSKGGLRRGPSEGAVKKQKHTFRQSTCMKIETICSFFFLFDSHSCVKIGHFRVTQHCMSAESGLKIDTNDCKMGTQRQKHKWS